MKTGNVKKDIHTSKTAYTYNKISSRHDSGVTGLETVDFDGLLVKAKAGSLVNQEVANLAALVALELDHLAHALGLGCGDDGSIASKLLLDDLEDLLVVKLGRNTLDRGQGLAAITLCRRRC